MSYEHILVAVDLTEECDPVIKRAAIALSSGAKVSLVHIVEPMAMAFGGDVPMDLHAAATTVRSGQGAHGPLDQNPE
jgi:universal stress protein A